ncbi:MAG: RHO alpha subunit C-terminal catalytic domain-containing protein, partial [Pseudomonadota bacterium]
TIRVDCWNGLVFVCLDESAASLRDWLGDIPAIADAFPRNAGMRWHGDVEKSGRVNWKTYGDNSCEGYHVGMVHKALGKSVGRDAVTIQAYPKGGFVGFDVEYRATDQDPSRRGHGFWIYKFPGLLLHFAPFSFNAETVSPLAVNRVHTRRWFWSDHTVCAREGVSSSDFIESSRQVMHEDMGICERVQTNLESGVYSSGYLSAHDEVGTIFFQQQVRSAMGNSL